MSEKTVTVVGAGVIGLWQALVLVRAGHRVRLIDKSADPASENSSGLAGAMLAPDCEAEGAPAIVRDLGRDGIARWLEMCPGVLQMGSLVVALGRDLPELTRFSKMTERFDHVDGARLGALEPDLAGRFGAGLYFPHEAHMAGPAALASLMRQVQERGGDVRLGCAWCGKFDDDAVVDQAWVPDAVIDCRGMAARGDLPTLRGVRGERLVIATDEVRFKRPVRLLHPRHPAYVVPWGDGRFVIGASVLESENDGAARVRSVLELLGAVYALHPSFGEAEVIDVSAGVRPSFPDNVPRVHVSRGERIIRVNGGYRHGFLLAPVLADAVAGYLESGVIDHQLIQIDG